MSFFGRILALFFMYIYKYKYILHIYLYFTSIYMYTHTSEICYFENFRIRMHTDSKIIDETSFGRRFIRCWTASDVYTYIYLYIYTMYRLVNLQQCTR